MAPLVIRAHAKLNLALAVAAPEPPGAPRAGWHRIASWFVPLALHDDLELTPLPTASASTHTIVWADAAHPPPAPRPSPIDWPADADLAVRAHRLLEAHAGRTLPVAMTLRKRTPVGGGLGGGSSDAAAMLAALCRLFHLHLTHADLAALSARLGSDVAYFLDPGSAPDQPPRPALVQGFGDRVHRGPEHAAGSPAPVPVTLLLPPFGCPTPAVYRALDTLAPAAPARRFADREATAAALALAGPAWAGADAGLFNDLEPAARLVEPRLGPMIDALRLAAAPLGRRVNMTGSGSTLFCLGEPAPALETAAGALGVATVATVIPACPASPAPPPPPR